VRLTTPTTESAEAMGGAFPGLYAIPTDLPMDAPSSVGLLLTLLILATAVTVVSGAVVALDVRREVALAQTRMQFVNGVSHELRTPLAVVRMYAELLRMGVVPEDRQSEHLSTIVRESERLTRLIDNVLAFSRLERGEWPHRPESVAPSELAASLQRSLGPLLDQDGFELTTRVEEALPQIRVDRDSMLQAITNLISNAAKFSGESRRIDLSFDREKDAVAIRVRDRGRGIDSEARDRVFEKFYRAPDVEAAGIPGAGIGLALVAEIARRHGGRVELETEIGIGSTFGILVPAAS
jgi:signal transduction histidine kinase